MRIKTCDMNCGSAFEPDASGLPYYCTSICARSCCTWRANCVDSGFWFLVCYAATQLATQLQQRRIQVVRSNKVARKRLTESSAHLQWTLDVKKYSNTGIHKRRIEQNTQIQ